MADVHSTSPQLRSESVAPGGPYYFRLSLIRIELVDCDGLAVPNERFEVYCDAKLVMEGNLDSEGRASIRPRSSASHEVNFPDLQEESWQEIAPA